MSPSERRSTNRVGFKVPAHITLSDGFLHRGYVIDLSETGAFVMMDAHVPLDKDIRLEFRVTPSIDCQASGHLARVMELGTSQGFGIEFTDSNSGYANFVRNLSGASQMELMTFIRDMRRVDIQVG